MEFYGEKPVGIELPPTVDLKVVDTAPGINRAHRSAQVKPATLETGLVVQVPPFVNTGDVIRVSTETASIRRRSSGRVRCECSAGREAGASGADASAGAADRSSWT